MDILQQSVEIEKRLKRVAYAAEEVAMHAELSLSAHGENDEQN